MSARRFFLLFTVFAVVARPGAAQTRGPSAPGIEVSFGAGFATRSDLSTADADLRARNGSFRLFSTSSGFSSSVPLDVRLGFPLSPRLTIEAHGAFSRPELRTSIDGDVEGAPPLMVTERLDRYVVDGGVVIALGGNRPQGVTPFVSGGIGWVRQLHEGLALTEDGISVRGGGGIKYPLLVRNRGRVRRLGLRADGALVVLSKDVSVGTGRSRHLAVSGSVYLSF